MRSQYILAIASVLAIGFGVKLFFFSAPTAEANVSSSIDVSKIHVGTMLPEQKTNDLSFVFTDNN